MIGDQTDILARLKAVLPNGWFQAPTPVLDALLSGFANGLAQCYALVQYAKNQTRIATATDGFLDLIAFDYLGTLLTRRQGEVDNPYRTRIKAALIREKVTRAGIIKTLVALTGRIPRIVEPALPMDTGAYRAPNSGYGRAGAYGSLLLPYQCFLTAYRPLGSGIPNVAGYGVSSAGYGRASQACYANIGQVTGQVTDADIYAAIAGAEAEGTTIWTKFLANFRENVWIA